MGLQRKTSHNRSVLLNSQKIKSLNEERMFSIAEGESNIFNITVAFIPRKTIIVKNIKKTSGKN